MDEQERKEYERVQLRFSEIARELNELAKSASELITEGSKTSGHRQPSNSNDSKRSRKAILNAAMLTYRLRRHRSKLFKDDSLFGEPAWDILLDLFIADLKGVAISITDACIGSAVPITTALRWISILQQSDLVTRNGDPRDGRRAYLSLTDRGFILMQSYFEEALDLAKK